MSDLAKNSANKSIPNTVPDGVRTQYQQMHARVVDTFTALPDKPEETPSAVLSALWSFVQNRPISTRLAETAQLDVLSQQQEQQLLACLAQLDEGVPTAHIVGRQNFCGLELIATPQALIPRQETELLVETALAIVDGGSDTADLSLIDLCCGCGNIALALANELPAARVIGSDMSAEAIELADKNAEFTGLKERVEFVTSDMLEAFSTPEFAQRVDLITCNPPYISSAKVEQMPDEISEHEPKLAFDGGPFGISIIQKLVSTAPSVLKPGGWIVFEVGLGQAEALLKRHAKNKHYQQAKGFSDANSNTRVIAMQLES